MSDQIKTQHGTIGLLMAECEQLRRDKATLQSQRAALEVALAQAKAENKELRGFLEEAKPFVALVGTWEVPNPAPGARALLCRMTSLPEMAIKEGFMGVEGGSPPVQAGGSPQE